MSNHEIELHDSKIANDKQTKTKHDGEFHAVATHDDKIGGMVSELQNENDGEFEEEILKVREKKDCRIDYEVFQWIFIIFFTLVAIIDRFTINMWPLWVDSPGPTIPGNFGVSVFALIGWISSRMMLVSSSYIFLFQCRTFWNWFVEQKYFNKYIKIGDIHQANNKIHYYVGIWFIGVPVILHVWAIVFAAIFPQNSVHLYDSWMRPSNPDGTSIAFYADNLLSLGINDIYRIVSTSVAFFILIPYSIARCCRDHNWSFAQWMHLFGATIYTVDLIRMKSHPHCWFFNCPFILWFICDRLYGIFSYRRCVANLVKKTHLDKNYIVLYLRVPEKLHNLHTIGDVYYVNHLDCGWDRSHPFTVFQNHKRKTKMIHSKEQLLPHWKGHKFTIRGKNDNDKFDESHSLIMSRQNTASLYNVHSNHSNHSHHSNHSATSLIEHDDEDEDEDDDENETDIPDNYDWNVGIIMAVFPKHSDCYHRKPWTKEIFETDVRFLAGLRAFGPYRSEYRILMKETGERGKFPKTPLVLIGTGAGCSFLIDFYQYIVNNNIDLDEKVYFYFTSRSIGMFQWFTDITCKKHINNLFVNAHITSRDNLSFSQNMINNKSNNNQSSRNSNIGRLSFEEILNDSSENTQVFFCGAPNVQEMVKKLCKKLSLTFHAGHSFY